ncbi:restriction endonuclease subunit S [Ruminococcus bicirculans (ex Wegman et al. 2014)]|uniref:restriction endonuclease subunit S n=1 Tax=Ruminococcus bicirculans (ex Wegman et al. 2014) TaxID=1160721 RepID=UPI003FEEF55A
MIFETVKFSDITVNHDKKRIPLSTMKRSKRQGSYRYYGAQGVIDYIDDYIFDGKYLLIAEDGENLKSKKQNIAQLAEGRFWVNNHAHIVQCNERCRLEYLCFMLNSMDLSGYITGSAQPKLSQANMNSISFGIPSVEMQDLILSVILPIEKRIATNTAINENLEQQAQALYKAWFVDFEPFGGVMPDDWKIISLGKLCDSISKKHKFNKDELIFLNTGDVENGMILHNNYYEVSQMPGQAKKSIAINDILYSEIRPINKHFAYVNFVADDYVVSTKLMVLRAKGISPRRLYQFLTMPDTLKELQVEAESRSGTFPQIRFDNIQQLEMIVASEQVEKEYSERLNTIYSMIDTNNSENKRLSALRDTLLPKLMNGEIDVSAVQV